MVSLAQVKRSTTVQQQIEWPLDLSVRKETLFWCQQIGLFTQTRCSGKGASCKRNPEMEKEGFDNKTFLLIYLSPIFPKWLGLSPLIYLFHYLVDVARRAINCCQMCFSFSLYLTAVVRLPLFRFLATRNHSINITYCWKHRFSILNYAALAESKLAI